MYTHLETDRVPTHGAGPTRATVGIAFVAFLALLAAGCASNPNVTVRTQVAPEASFQNYHTFMIMRPTLRNPNPAAADNPMLDNSITNDAIRLELRRQLEARGYTADGRDADIGIAFYAASRQTLDVTNVDYGYPYRPWWLRPRQQITPVTEGTVVIDVIDRRTNRLVWRGSGRSQVSDDPGEYSKDLKYAVAQVLKKLPKPGS